MKKCGNCKYFNKGICINTELNKSSILKNRIKIIVNNDGLCLLHEYKTIKP